VRNFTITILLTSLAITGVVSPSWAEEATMDEALTVAENWVALVVHLKGHWAGSNAPIVGIEELKRDERVLGYFCTVEPQGFVVVSLHKELAPAKVYSTGARFDPRSEEGFADVVKSSMAHTLDAIEQQLGPMDLTTSEDIQRILEINYRPAWDMLLTDTATFGQDIRSGDVGRNFQEGAVLLSSDWDQGPPYNDQCPPDACDHPPCHANTNTVVGCVATAGAQIMRYWGWPPWYDWSNMPDILAYGPAPACTPPPQWQINVVAQLCHEVGVAAEMDYGCSSGASHSDMRDAYEGDFHYGGWCTIRHRDDFSEDNWFQRIIDQCSVNRPMQYANEGHSFVCDGWRIIEISGVPTKQYHMNWGHGPPAHPTAQPSTAWYTLGAIPSGGLDVEEMIEDICPNIVLGAWLQDTYPLDPDWPYRYFGRDTSGDSAIFEPGQWLYFLPGITVTGTSTTGDVIRIDGSAPLGAELHPAGDRYRGIKIDDGAIALTSNGAMVFDPLGAPRYLCATEVESSWVTIMWEARHGDPDEFIIERRVGTSGPYDHLATWPASNPTAYTDATVLPSTTYCYRIMATKNDITRSEYTYELCVPTPSLAPLP